MATFHSGSEGQTQKLQALRRRQKRLAFRAVIVPPVCWGICAASAPWWFPPLKETLELRFDAQTQGWMLLVLMLLMISLPVLIRENALFPVGVNDRTTDADDADRVVLHWFQPDFTTECTLADGTFYRVTQIGAGFRWETNATKEWHLIIHRGSEEQFVR